jgi:hypothetical protein
MKIDLYHEAIGESKRITPIGLQIQWEKGITFVIWFMGLGIFVRIK